MTSQERRRDPRIHDESLSLRLDAGSFDTVTHTLNVSASGIYCKLDREIPLMSRVKLILMIPDPAGDAKPKGLEVEGVVVREHPVIIDGKIRHYDAAIFFDNLSPGDRETITQYISRKKA